MIVLRYNSIYNTVRDEYGKNIVESPLYLRTRSLILDIGGLRGSYRDAFIYLSRRKFKGSRVCKHLTGEFYQVRYNNEYRTVRLCTLVVSKLFNGKVPKKIYFSIVETEKIV